MVRIGISVEGTTEERFVEMVLSDFAHKTLFLYVSAEHSLNPAYRVDAKLSAF